MTGYEELLTNAEKENVIVIENYDLSNTRLKGLYCDGVVALDKNIKTEKEKKCVMAEELGHYYTAVGNILDQSSAANRKQELHGRAYAYNKLIGLIGIVNAYKHHCHSLSESAEYLGVTEEFMKEALSYYKGKYGTSVTVDSYIIFFEPHIAVLELL